MQLTNERLVYGGVTTDLVSMRDQPLHAMPMFKVTPYTLYTYVSRLSRILIWLVCYAHIFFMSMYIYVHACMYDQYMNSPTYISINHKITLWMCVCMCVCVCMMTVS